MKIATKSGMALPNKQTCQFNQGNFEPQTTLLNQSVPSLNSEASTTSIFDL